MNGGPAKLKLNPFFHGINFSNIRNEKAPFIPELKSITDTSYFPIDDLANAHPLDAVAESAGEMTLDEGGKKDLAFVGYTFKKFDMLTRRNAL